MDFILKEVPICADKEFEMIKITDDVRKVVEESGVEKGIVYVITEHSRLQKWVCFHLINLWRYFVKCNHVG